MNDTFQFSPSLSPGLIASLYLSPSSPDSAKESAIPGRTLWLATGTWVLLGRVPLSDCSMNLLYRCHWRWAGDSDWWALAACTGWTDEVVWSCPQNEALVHSRSLVLETITTTKAPKINVIMYQPGIFPKWGWASVVVIILHVCLWWHWLWFRQCNSRSQACMGVKGNALVTE